MKQKNMNTEQISGPRMQYRQGDVLIEAITTLHNATNKAMKQVGRNVVLAAGEATGHAHVLACETIVSAQDNPDGSFFLTFDTPAEVRHQEHNKITLPPGTYRVLRQREYTPEAIRNVAD